MSCKMLQFKSIIWANWYVSITLSWWLPLSDSIRFQLVSALLQNIPPLEVRTAKNTSVTTVLNVCRTLMVPGKDIGLFLNYIEKQSRTQHRKKTTRCSKNDEFSTHILHHRLPRFTVAQIQLSDYWGPEHYKFLISLLRFFLYWQRMKLVCFVFRAHLSSFRRKENKATNEQNSTKQLLIRNERWSRILLLEQPRCIFSWFIWEHAQFCTIFFSIFFAHFLRTGW